MTIKKLSLPLALAVGVSALTGPAAVAQSDVTIGFLQRTMTAPYYVAMWAEAERLAGELGFNLVASQADSDAVRQMQQLEDMVSRGVDAVVMNAVDPVTTATAVQDAIDAGLQVVFIDTEVPDVGANATYGADNEGIGHAAGLIVSERVGAGPINVGILEGFAGDAFVGPARERGFLAGLEEGGTEYNIVIRGQANYAQDLAVGATEDMLTAAPDIDLIFGYNDAMALGALSVIEDQGLDILVAGIDGQKEAYAEIARGCDSPYVATGLNSPTLAARDGFAHALGVATGEIEPTNEQPFTFTLAAGIGCENVDEFYDPESAF